MRVTTDPSAEKRTVLAVFKSQEGEPKIRVGFKGDGDWYLGTAQGLRALPNPPRRSSAPYNERLRYYIEFEKAVTQPKSVTFYGTQQDIHPKSDAIIAKVLSQTDSSAPLEVNAVIIAGQHNGTKLIQEVRKLHMRRGVLDRVTVRHYRQEGHPVLEFDVSPKDVTLMGINSPCKITAKGQAVYPSRQPVKDKTAAEEEQEEHEAVMEELKAGTQGQDTPEMLADGITLVIDMFTVLYETATDPTAKDRMYGSAMPQDKRLSQFLEQIIVCLKRPAFEQPDQEAARFHLARLADRLNSKRGPKSSIF